MDERFILDHPLHKGTRPGNTDQSHKDWVACEATVALLSSLNSDSQVESSPKGSKQSTHMSTLAAHQAGHTHVGGWEPAGRL